MKSSRVVALDAGADEWDTLTTALNCQGVRHLAPVKARRRGLPGTPRALFERLALTREPRLHQALVFLLLTRPELAAEARAAIDGLPAGSRDRATRRYVAAAALQRMARTRIGLRLGPQPLIEPAYLDELNLPPLDEAFGRETLIALAGQEQARYGYDAWQTYGVLLDLFLNELRRPNWGSSCDSAPIARG
jgi:hypothetical protein